MTDDASRTLAHSLSHSLSDGVLHGVDFSGGDRPEGKIWVATHDTTHLEAPVRLRRGFDHNALVELIAASRGDGRRHLWRIDAPFGLALEMIDAHGLDHDWRAVAEWMAAFGSPREWRTACRIVSRREPRRATDRIAHTPMAPSNLRIFKQTWSVIVRVLLPLLERGIRIEPVAGPIESTVVVAEGCPSSILRANEWPARGYKGRGTPPRLVREELLRRISKSGIPLPKPIVAMATDDTEGDGVDALLLLLPPTNAVVPAEEEHSARVEAWVF